MTQARRKPPRTAAPAPARPPAQPFVAVGVAVYNRAAGLQRMVDSLLAQTQQNFKIVICDNASTDPRVAEVAQAYVKADRRISYVRNPKNLGMTGNFKQAWKECAKLQPEYFLWAADDDYYHPTYIQHCLDLMAQTGATAAMPTPVMCNRHDVPIYAYPGFSKYTNAHLRHGTLRMWLYYLRFLADPVVHSKGSLPYMLFQFSTMQAMMAGFEDGQLERWGGDNALMFSYLREHRIACSDALLMDKNFPTERTHDWFPLAWCYQPALKQVPTTYRLFMRRARGWGEKLAVLLYVGGLVAFWGTVGVPARAVSLGLRWVDRRWPLVARIQAEKPAQTTATNRAKAA